MTEKAPINWLNSIFLISTPLAALVFVPWYGLTIGYQAYEWFWFFFYMAATGMSITAGYHRLWSHKTYKAHWSIRFFVALFGAASCQNSILNWSSDHRVHHRFVDDPDKDPYAATRGFFYSHMGWIMRRYPQYIPDHSNVKDLMRDPIAAWQHKYYWQIVLFTNGAIPLALGFAVGRPLGVFMLAFLLRVVLNHHFTFFINSLAHIWGRRPYSEDHSSRDNDFLALFTYGEGYHNFHHTFQHDFRNGIRWWQFDPSKWLINAFSWVGLTSDLKRASKFRIEKMRLTMQFERALAKAEKKGDVAKMKPFLEDAYQKCMDAMNDWSKGKQEWYQMKKNAMVERWEKVEARKRYLDLKSSWKIQRRQWRLLMAELAV